MQMHKIVTILAAAVAGALATGALSGCEVDDSLPSRPRQPWFNADEKSQDNAKKREEEKKPRELPTGGQEYPGQTDARPMDGAGVIMLDVADTAPATGPGTLPATAPAATTEPAGATTVVAAAPPLPPAGASWGTLPHLHTQALDHYADGYTVVPGVAYAAEHQWGQVLPLPNAPHRAWPTTKVNYEPGLANHNPTYYSLAADRYPDLSLFATPDRTGYGSGTGAAPVNAATIETTAGGTSLTTVPVYSKYIKLNGAGTSLLTKNGFDVSGLPAGGTMIVGLGNELVIESPWFIAQTIWLPVRMYKRNPWSLVQSRVSQNDPLYLEYMPDAGAIVPTAYPGQIRWTYPWTRDLNATPSTIPDLTTTTPANTSDMEPKERP